MALVMLSRCHPELAENVLKVQSLAQCDHLPPSVWGTDRCHSLGESNKDTHKSFLASQKNFARILGDVFVHRACLALAFEFFLSSTPNGEAQVYPLFCAHQETRNRDVF